MGFGYTFAFFFFLSTCMHRNITWIYCAGDKVHCLRTIHGSHDTIHMLKNYFVTAFSIFNF